MLSVYLSNVSFLDKGYFPFKSFYRRCVSLNRENNGFCKYFFCKIIQYYLHIFYILITLVRFSVCVNIFLLKTVRWLSFFNHFINISFTNTEYSER